MLKIFGLLIAMGFCPSIYAANTTLTDAEIAKMMQEEHKKNAAETKTLAKDNEIKPVDSEMSKQLVKENKENAKALKSKDKKSFDKSYAQMMVAGHEKVLKTLDETLIPAAKDPEFKGHLEKTRGAVATHLSHAKDLDSKIQ